jgi:hypothetical protein
MDPDPDPRIHTSALSPTKDPDPDPAIFAIDLQDVNQKFLPSFF